MFARALRAKAPVKGPAVLFYDARLPDTKQRELSGLLSAVLDIKAVHVIEPTAISGRALPMMLVERPLPQEFSDDRDNLLEGVQRLLTLRGWTVHDRPEGSIRISDETHEFEIIVKRHNEEEPQDNSKPLRPAFGRAPLLVVHEAPKKEWLVEGNLGSLFHVGLEDIGLMVPGTSWIWPVLRRQLGMGSAQFRSPSAVALLAALAAEAFDLGRYHQSLAEFDLERATDVLRSGDKRAAIRLSSAKPPADGAELILSGMGGTVEPYLRLRIRNDGPFVEVH